MEKETLLNHSTPHDAKPVLSDGVVSEIADQYEEQVRLEELYRKDKEQKIKELEQLISSSRNKSIYDF
jgi:hypothetical protein